MGFFSKRLTDEQRGAALILVDHLQTMLAYQQLSMEQYNDTIAALRGSSPPGSEIYHRPQFILTESDMIEIIPALEKKREIFEVMKTEHNDMITYNEGSLKNAYNDMTSLIDSLLIRVNFMIDTYRRWLNHEIENADATKYDEDENKAIIQATKSLNDIIFNKLGLSKEEFLSIMCDATNTVRKTIGLETLDYDNFSIIYLNGLAGSPMRLFNK